MPTILMSAIESAGKGEAIARLASALVAGAILVAPRISLACAVCFSGRDDATQLAFRISTGVMTFLPFILVGGLLLWLRKRFRVIAQQERELAEDDRAAADAAIGQPTIR